jgi:predicted permease
MLGEDVRYSLRAIRRAPSYAVPALVSLGLGLGLGGAIISLLRPESASGLAIEAVREPGWIGAWSHGLVSASQIQSDDFRTLLFIGIGIAVAAIVIAAITFLVLNFIRVSARQRELAVLSALGATSRRLQLRLAIEAVLLVAAACALGLLLGIAGYGTLAATWPHSPEAASQFTVQLWGLLIGVAVPAAATALPPIVAAGRFVGGLQLGRLTAAGDRVTADRFAGARRDGLVVMQVAASVLLLVVAAMLARATVPSNEAFTLGFDPQDTLTAELNLSGASHWSSAERARYFEEVLERVEGLPEVEAVGLASPGTWLALGGEGVATARCGGCSIGGMFMLIAPTVARHHAVSPGFFRALGSRLTRGREFDAGDRIGSPHVAIVNGSFAERHFAEGDPLGKQVQIGGPRGEWYRVVGVVQDIEGLGIGSSLPSTAAVYLPLLQQPPSSVDLAARVRADRSADLSSALFHAIESTDSRVTYSEALWLEARLRRHAAPLRWLGAVIGIAGGLALLLAAVGLLAVMRYDVSLRLREIGVRVALGATPWVIGRMILKRALRLTLVGCAFGLWVLPPVVSLIRTIAPNATVMDPVVLGAVPLLVMITALIGGMRPAWVVAHHDPAATLRNG